METTLLKNPVIWSDFPDMDMLRVGSTYYMVSTSFHMMPGCPILKSTDLIHWEIVNYVFDTFADNNDYNLTNGGNVYGFAAASPCLRYHNGYYYVLFNSTDMEDAYIFRTDDLENGKFEHWSLGAMFFDPSIVFCGETPYMINGCGEIFINRLKEDLSAIEPDERNGLLFEAPRSGFQLRCEGCHAYYINGMYYLLFYEWKNSANGADSIRQEACYRSKDIFGPYERRVIFAAKMNPTCHGVACGAIFDTPEGEWFAVLTRDQGALGRTPCIFPVTWEDGWPMIGVAHMAPEQIVVPFRPSERTKPTTCSDSFRYSENKLALCWQWNHNPDNEHWSVTERPGFLRLTNGTLCDGGVLQARNTVTQRTEGPKCSCEVRIELDGLKPGDCTGLIALLNYFGMVGVRKKENGEQRIVVCVNDGEHEEKEVASLPFSGSEIYLKMAFDFRDEIDLVSFFYSEDGMEWNRIGDRLHLEFDLEHMTGCHMGIFCYAEIETGGYADVEYFRYQREITD